jgi:hypothetical protein
MFLKAYDESDRPVIINLSDINKVEVASIHGVEDGVVVFMQNISDPVYLNVDLNVLFDYLNVYSEQDGCLEIHRKPKNNNTEKPKSSTVVSLHKPTEEVPMKKGKGKGKGGKPC